ncbi:MAG: hypothetical protein AB8B52_06780 [Winogradskyella sp.]
MGTTLIRTVFGMPFEGILQNISLHDLKILEAVACFTIAEFNADFENY